MTSQTLMREGQRKTTPGLNSCKTSPVHSAYECQSLLSHFLTKCSTSKPQICVPIGSRSCWSISESLKDNFLLQLTVSKMSPSQTWGIQRVLRWGSRQRQRERCRNLTSGKMPSSILCSKELSKKGWKSETLYLIYCNTEHVTLDTEPVLTHFFWCSTKCVKCYTNEQFKFSQQHLLLYTVWQLCYVYSCKINIVGKFFFFA